jgi:DNA-binding MarR family transcriptional regulator
MFWKALDHLHRWQRENLPGCESPQGNEILIWLLKCKAGPRPLKDLYRSSRFSEPTMRTCLRAFIDRGLVEIEVNGSDMRNRFARVTPKFETTIAAYRQRFGEVALLIEAFESVKALGDAGSSSVAALRPLAVAEA